MKFYDHIFDKLPFPIALILFIPVLVINWFLTVVKLLIIIPLECPSFLLLLIGCSVLLLLYYGIGSFFI